MKRMYYLNYCKMKEMKRNPIGYRTVTRMEEESASRSEEQAQNENRTTASEQAAQDHFEAGGWQREAEETAADEERMADLGNKRGEFTQKKGLSRVRQQLVLLWDYLSAVTSGRYKEYSTWAYLKVVACLLYVVSPFDLIPDFFPWVGWLDDIAVVIYVCGLVKEELDMFSIWQARQRMAATE